MMWREGDLRCCCERLPTANLAPCRSHSGIVVGGRDRFGVPVAPNEAGFPGPSPGRVSGPTKIRSRVGRRQENSQFPERTLENPDMATGRQRGDKMLRRNKLVLEYWGNAAFAKVLMDSRCDFLAGLTACQI